MRAAFDVRDFSVGAGGEFWDQSWVVDVGFFTVADGFANAGFAVGVQAPGIDGAGFGYGEGVVGAAADCCDGFAF